MPKTYGYDLRTKVIESIEIDGLKICQAAKLFHINHNTCWSWLKSRIRKCLDQFNSLRDAIEHILMLSSL